ncbi:MAG TPA: hypothetical protein VHM30_14520 [Gemmatimonadaceae bacterium]|nr:hypothetical protein [Gemmatimonadaceae bacterium]
MRDLYGLFDASPRLTFLEHGLTRLTAAVAYLPPVAPTLLLLGAALWVGPVRRAPTVARWLSLGAVPLAADAVLRALGTLLAPPPANAGELLDLPMRFSPGPRLLADLAGVQLGPSLQYWTVVCSAAAIIVVYCVARVLLGAEEAALEPAELRRRRQRRDPVAALQAGVVATGCFAAIAFAGQLALPWVTQIFLQLFG